ncbi:transposase [Actinomadura fibrosa]|uniref:Transposase n=1 Tax=Actinomadura fibrosa TaxID=111802 RepID=A0ABW2Y070_9ACTN
MTAVKGLGTRTVASLLIAVGDNPERLRSEAAFAHLCGVAPIPASSGKTNRHRLNRTGDRQANHALYMIAVSRMAWEPRTRAYVTRRTAEGKTKPEIIRCLKRHIAREVHHLPVPEHPASNHSTTPLDSYKSIGKAERYHRTLAEEWACARPYLAEAERRAALAPWLHMYNHHRGHTGTAPSGLEPLPDPR